MSQNLRDAVSTILTASADRNEQNITDPIDDMFVHTLTNYARAKQESFNLLRMIASLARERGEQDVRGYFGNTARRIFRRITPEQIAAIYEAILADEQTLTGI